MEEHGCVYHSDADRAEPSLVGDSDHAEDAVCLEEDAVVRRERRERLDVVEVALPHAHVHQRPRHGAPDVRVVVRERAGGHGGGLRREPAQRGRLACVRGDERGAPEQRPHKGLLAPPRGGGPAAAVKR